MLKPKRKFPFLSFSVVECGQMELAKPTSERKREGGFISDFRAVLVYGGITPLTD